MTMTKIGSINIILIAVSILIAHNLSLADDQHIYTPDVWNVELTPYFWAAEIDGDITLRGRTGQADVSFSDIMDNLDIAFMGRTEAWKGEWGLFIDGLYMDLGSEFSTPQGLVSADMDVRMTILEFGFGYHLWETQVGKEGSQRLSFDMLGGGRYINLKSEVDIVPNGPLGILPGRTFSRREEWVDPIVGGRLQWDMSEKFAAAVRFDLGGFGIGEGSNLSWNLLAGIDYQLNDTMKLKAGYRILDMDYEAGSGNDEFGIDAQFRGPILGLTFLF